MNTKTPEQKAMADKYIADMEEYIAKLEAAMELPTAEDFILKWENGLCLSTDGNKAGVVGPLQASSFSSLNQAEFFAKKCQNGLKEHPKVVRRRVALAQSIVQSQSSIDTMRNFDKYMGGEDPLPDPK